MRTARKPNLTSQPFSPREVAAAKAAAVPKRGRAIDWSKSTVTPGGGVAATIQVLRRTRGLNKNPTKEQVAIRFDREVLTAFRSAGPGWQTRMNAALKESADADEKLTRTLRALTEERSGSSNRKTPFTS